VKFTLRTKGVAAFLVLVSYVATVGFILSQERSKLLGYALEMERVYAEESALAKASYAVSHSLLKLQEKFFSSSLGPAFEEQTALDVELVQAGLLGLLEFYPQIQADVTRLNQDLVRLRKQPSRESMVWLREHGQEMTEHLDQVTRQVRARRYLLWDRYRQVYDTMSVIAVIMGLLGAVFFGAVMTLFLTRLAWDIRKLAARALDVVSGYRGPPIAVTRNDEVGDLMEAVNRMQSELRHWEQQVELSREQRFHKEKMAAIGSLAAAVAHEINNPIAAIAGIAQSMKDSDRSVPGGDTGIDPATLILEQARRITTISRQIAELTAPHPPDRELLDLNALVRNTCSFIGYDVRFRGINLVLELDSQIPAISAVADHLTQVLMNLLINAADALEDILERKPTICVSTRASNSDVEMTVTDNGRGMDSVVLARAFEESYTTKPADKGRGLGLFLCKSLIEGSGGSIRLESVSGAGTSASIRLPLLQESGV
jgi:signal transduction histidine kinase